MNKILQEDIKEFVSTLALKENLRKSTFLITGATGLIGSTLIHCLLALNEGITIIAPLRNKEKALGKFVSNELENIRLLECDLLTFNYATIGEIDYIVHCAAPTSSKYFVEHPVETFDIIYQGTKQLLDYAVQYPPKAMVFVSSLEVYGSISDDRVPVTEDLQGYINPLDVRSSYPMAKKAAETLCHLYAKEHGINVMIARLTQTNGAGVDNSDNRILVQFARLAAKNEDIVLHTKGESARPYCYTTDAISAILYILLKGEKGYAYNVANEDTYTSAKGLAEFIRANFNSNIQVRIELNENMGYAPITKLKLSTERLKKLGWMPQYGLSEIIGKLIACIKN